MRIRMIGVGVAMSVVPLVAGATGAAQADEAHVGPAAPEASCQQLKAPSLLVGPPLSFYRDPDPGVGLGVLAPALPEVAARLPRRVTLRTAHEGFNWQWAFALVDGNIYVTEQGRDAWWRQVWTPACIRGGITAISVDRGMLMATDRDGRLYTMSNAEHGPQEWAWSSRFGGPIWLNPAGDRVRHGSRAWSLSWLDNGIPFPDFWNQRQTWTDRAGHHQPVGGAGVTTVFVLNHDGNRVAILDPWLPGGNATHPDDYSYELSTPEHGRFRAVNLSSAGSTTLLINKFGDMYTRLWDFDISGADPIFRYSYDDQSGRPAAPNLVAFGFDSYIPVLGYAAWQLPAPDWVRQPKVPGEITADISVVQTGWTSTGRELRVEGRRAGRTGYWHKPIDPAARWAFTPTGRPLRAPLLANPAADHTSATLAPPTGVRFGYADPAGWTVDTNDFDYAATPAPLRVCAGSHACVGLRLHLVDGIRLFRQPDGLSDVPRYYAGNLEVPPEASAHAATWPPALRQAMSRLTGDVPRRDIAVFATARTLVLLLPSGPLALARVPGRTVS